MLSIVCKWYAPNFPILLTTYGSSQLGWSLSVLVSAVFSKTRLKTKFPGLNNRSHVFLLY